MRWFDLAFVRCVALVLVLSLAGCRSPKFECEYLGNLGEWTDSVSTSLEPSSFFPTWPQDIAVHDSLLFSFHAQGYVYVFDLKHKSLVSHFKIATHNHCNNACFGAEKLTPDSAFPLLYLTESVTNCDCEVFDITLDGARKIQNISLVDHPEGTHGAGWSVDPVSDKLILIYNHSAYRFGLPDKSGEIVKYSVDDRKSFCALYDGESQSSDTDGRYLVELTGLGEGHDGLSLYDSKRRKSYRYIFKHNDIPQQIPSFAKTIEIPYGGEPEGICFVGEKNPSAEFFVAFADEKYSDLHLYKFRIR